MLWKVAPQCLSKTWTRSEEVLNFLPEIHDSVSMDTLVALIMAKTASPFLRFIRLTEPVVMIEVTNPAAVLMTIAETTLVRYNLLNRAGQTISDARAHNGRCYVR